MLTRYFLVLSISILFIGSATSEELLAVPKAINPIELAIGLSRIAAPGAIIGRVVAAPMKIMNVDERVSELAGCAAGMLSMNYLNREGYQWIGRILFFIPFYAISYSLSDSWVQRLKNKSTTHET